MTRRDLQLEAREKGRPWDTGKNVEQSSPLGADPSGRRGRSSGKQRCLWPLTVNGAIRRERRPGRADLAGRRGGRLCLALAIAWSRAT
ncbi:hypothetical protein ACRAWD_23110 [Caulobacter segnis]